MNSPQTQETPQQKVVNYLNRKGKLELWSGVLANQMIQDHQTEQRKNQEAEGAFVRRQIWGESAQETSEDDMHTQTILGDVNHPAPIVIAGQQPSGSSLAKVLAGLAIGTLIPTAGIGGFAISKLLQAPTQQSATPEEKPKEFTDESLDIGLMRFEDLKK
jgi:hypothetical protein